MVSFRDVYHKICAFELNDFLKKLAKNCADIKTAKFVVFYGFVDPKQGLMLELLGTAKSGKTRINANEPYKGERITISASKVNTELSVIESYDKKSKYAARIESLDFHKVPDEIEKSREDKDLDPFRDNVFPDRVSVRLLKDGKKLEKVLVEIIGMTAHEFVGQILENPKQNFGLKKGDEIRFEFERGDDYKAVDCISDLDRDASDKDYLSEFRRKYKLQNLMTVYSDKVVFSVGSADVFNYALDKNNVNPIRNVCIRNITLDPINDIYIRVTNESDIFDTYEYPVPLIKAKDKFSFDIPLTVHHNRLIGIKEAIKVNFKVELLDQDSDNPICPSISWTMDVLPDNQWPGDDYLPYLAAFVTPNHPYMSDLQSIAISWLKNKSLKPALEDYQGGDPNRVKELTAACYAAVQKKNIAYITAPVSYEKGQRIRTVSEVIDGRKGTCMDMTLLYASLIESIGLHPVLILVKGHIFLAIWLIEDAELRNSVEKNGENILKDPRLLFVECTKMCSATENVVFEKAEQAGFTNIQYNLLLEKFDCAIDVFKVRRKENIISIDVYGQTGLYSTSNDLSDDELTEAPKPIQYRFIETSGPQKAVGPTNKIELWESKLIDLSTSNKLLNIGRYQGINPDIYEEHKGNDDALRYFSRFYKNLAISSESSNIIPLISCNLPELEDSLTDGEEFDIQKQPSYQISKIEWKLFISLASHYNLFEEPDWNSIQFTSPEFFRAEARSHRLYSLCHPDDLNKNLKNIYRKAKDGEREYGINSLYLVLGMLRWFGVEDEECRTPLYAPLILSPVEIDLKPGGLGYSMHQRTGKSHFNTALLEMLRQMKNLEISNLDPLPMDDHGLDVAKIFAMVRGATQELKGWEVIETAAVGIFDLSKISMWNDIHTAYDKLERNKVIRSLIKQRVDWDIEEKSALSDDYMTFVTLPVDATQLEAIDYAGRGNTFVLHGPPGTGKSQTIAGMIGNALANHKTVLFVAQKKTALDVVQRRLIADLGIGDHCLALHSDSKITSVLEQFEQTIRKKGLPSFSYFQRDAEKTENQREKLDIYREHLHKKQLCGLTLHQLIDLYCREDKKAPYITFHRNDTKNLNQETLQQQIPLIDQMISVKDGLDETALALLPEIGISNYDGTVRSEVNRVTEQYESALEKVLETGKQTAEFLHQKAPESPTDLILLSKTISEMAQLENREDKFPDVSAVDHESAIKYYTDKENLEKQRGELLKIWTPDFLKKKPSIFREKIASAQKGFLGKLTGNNVKKVIKELEAYSHRQFTESEVLAFLDQVEAFQNEETLFENNKRKLSKNTLDLISQFDNASAFEQVYQQACEYQQREKELTGGRNLADLRNDQQAAEAFQTFIQAYERYLVKRKAFNETLGRPEAKRNTCSLSDEISLCNMILRNRNAVRKAALYNQYRSACIDAGLEPVVEAYENGMDDPDVLKTAYRKGMYYSLIQGIINSDTVMNHFMGSKFNNDIERYKEIDAVFCKKSITELHRRLAENLPSPSESHEIAMQMTTLQKAIKRGSRGIALRQLFEQIPDILFRIFPCMLMCPETVAQFLPQKNDLFDLVIFDEASQMETCDAIGALYRGKDAVIVGDPEQMAPTRFFAGSGSQVVNPDIEDLGSILDEVLAISVPSRFLKWHYRSAHESLIAFSNKNFYKNGMFTFPSADDRVRKIRLVPVKSNYKESVNKNEAIEIVKEIIHRFNDPMTPSDHMFGVIAFNEKQQKQIEELLQKQCDENRALHEWVHSMPDGKHERVEIKPLEKVQGDEWDTVIFSITFGPDEKGVVRQNFGPINKDGGGKRLNVAFSRARKDMMVYTGMRASDITVTEKSPDGVRAFHDFLDFVEYLNQDQQSADKASSKDKNAFESSGIVKQLCDILNSKGYDCVSHIGSSDFQIDIGILNPYDSTRYLLGIMLDGETYRMTENTKDREISQINLLEKFRGWKIFRIWALDWWDDREFIIEQLLEELDNLKSAAAERASHDQPVQEEISSDNLQLDTELERQSEEVSAELKAEEDKTESEASEVKAATVGQKDIQEPQTVPEPGSDGEPAAPDKEPDEELKSEPSAGTKTDDEQKPVFVTEEPGQNMLSDQSAEKTVTVPESIIDVSTLTPESGHETEASEQIQELEQAPMIESAYDSQSAALPAKAKPESEPKYIPDSEKEPVKVITLMGLLQEAGVEVIDKRKNGGSLWIIGGWNLKSLTQRCREIGVNFHYKKGGGKATKGRDAWWTSDKDPAPFIVKPAVKESEFEKGFESVQTINSYSEPVAVSETTQTEKTYKTPEKVSNDYSPDREELSTANLGDDSDESPGEQPAQTEEACKKSDTDQLNDAVAETLESRETAAAEPYTRKLYVWTDYPVTQVGWQEYCQPSNKAEIAQRAVLIVEGEGVIERDLLIAKLYFSFGVRSVDKVAEATEKALRFAKIKTTKVKGIPYCWALDIDPKTYTGFRYHEDHKRKDSELPLPEIRNAVVRTLMDHGPLNEDDLLFWTSRTFGYARLGMNLRARLLEGIAYAVSDKLIRLNKQKIYELREE